ncbi:MAG: DUF3450 domain-containing protein [Oleispira sp.]|nr:DUF3450 domain-containing protein [Oleispira sp.]MBL4882601.1 DUF3450 domain-containing protein [Oleispira sp.]
MLERNQELIFNRFPAKRLVLAVLAAGSLVAATSVMAANNLDTAIMQGEQRAATAVTSQLKIDSLDDDIRDIERKYRAVNKENDGLSVYIEQLNKQLLNQQIELKNIDSSIRQVTLIERQITPLMLRMIDSLELFVAADVPFQKEERSARIASLKDLMGRSDVTVAEKYRKVMAAYQKEMDYGRTIKTYRSTLNLAGNGEPDTASREVDFLRVGRLSLMFLSLDGQSLGVWDQQAKAWQPLESEYKAKLTTALRIAREQAAPSLIKIPVAAPIKLNISSLNSNIAYGDVK